MEHPWMQFAGFGAAIVASAWVVELLWDRLVTPLAVRAEVGVDDRMMRAARRAVQSLIVSGGLLAVLAVLRQFPDIGDARITPLLDGLLHGATVLAAAWLASRLAEELAANWLDRLSRGADTRLDDRFMPLLRRALRLLFLFVAITVILGRYDVRITALLGAAGIASLAVALAAQETLANIIGGLTLVVDRPFRVGDWIELPDGRAGRVHDIGMRTTKILTYQHTLLIIPNAELVKTSIINQSYPDPVVYVRQPLGVAYGTDVDRARRVLADAAASHPRVLSTPPPAVWLTGFGDSALDLLVVYAVPAFEELIAIRTEVGTAMLHRLAAEGIEIPFPQRVVHLKSSGT